MDVLPGKTAPPSLCSTLLAICIRNQDHKLSLTQQGPESSPISLSFFLKGLPVCGVESYTELPIITLLSLYLSQFPLFSSSRRSSLPTPRLAEAPSQMPLTPLYHEIHDLPTETVTSFLFLETSDFPGLSDCIPSWFFTSKRGPYSYDSCLFPQPFLSKGFCIGRRAFFLPFHFGISP